MIHNGPHSGYALGHSALVFSKQKHRQHGGSIFSAIFSGIKSLFRPLLGSFTKQAVKQTVVEGAKTLGKEALKSALPEAGKALGQFGVSKLNEVLKKAEKPMAELVQAVPQANEIVKRIPKKIDQSMVDNELRKFREKLNSLSLEDETSGAGLKKRKGRKIMDYMM
jgi:hypothetical protein